MNLLIRQKHIIADKCAIIRLARIICIKKNLPSVILNLIQNLSEAQAKTYTDPESTFVASACECGVAVQGDGFQVPDPMFKYCKLILAGIGGAVG